MSGRNPTAAEIAKRASLAAASLALSELLGAAPNGARLALVPALPEKPKGWMKKLLMHLNMGRAGHCAVYAVVDDAGKPTPIRYQYHTKDPCLNGFTLEGLDGVVSWAQLRDAWPAWVERNKAVAP